jgi:hypothetical protein
MGIQEFPQQNEAQADIVFEGFRYNADNYQIPRPKEEVTPRPPDVRSPNYYQEMGSFPARERRVVQYSGKGTGVLKHYSDGRWVLTKIQFNFVEVNPDIQIGAGPASSGAGTTPVVSAPSSSQSALGNGSSVGIGALGSTAQNVPATENPLAASMRRYPGAKIFVVRHDHTAAGGLFTPRDPSGSAPQWLHCEGALIFTPDRVIYEPWSAADGKLHGFNEPQSGVKEMKVNTWPIQGQRAFHIRLASNANLNFVSQGIDPANLISAAQTSGK